MSKTLKAAFDNPLQHGLDKFVTPGKRGTTEFKPSTKKIYTAPSVIESYVNDSGEVIHILDNGHEQSKIAYDALWYPAPTGKVHPPNYKPPKQTKI